MQQERQQFESYVRDHGLRMTPTRRAVFEEIFLHHEHIDADRLHEAIGRNGLRVSRASVYRNLDLLADCGLVRKVRLGNHRVLYEHLHEGMDHDHMVCRECGRLVEYLHREVRDSLRELCAAHGFDPEDLSVQVVGRCLTCRRAREAREAPPAPS